MEGTMMYDYAIFRNGAFFRGDMTLREAHNTGKHLLAIGSASVVVESPTGTRVEFNEWVEAIQKYTAIRFDLRRLTSTD